MCLQQNGCCMFTFYDSPEWLYLKSSSFDSTFRFNRTQMEHTHHLVIQLILRQTGSSTDHIIHRFVRTNTVVREMETYFPPPEVIWVRTTRGGFCCWPFQLLRNPAGSTPHPDCDLPRYCPIIVPGRKFITGNVFLPRFNSKDKLQTRSTTLEKN